MTKFSLQLKKYFLLIFCISWMLGLPQSTFAASFEDIVVGRVQYVASAPGGYPKTPPSASSAAACAAYGGVLQSSLPRDVVLDGPRPSCAEGAGTYWAHTVNPDGTANESIPEFSIQMDSFCADGSYSYDGVTCVIRAYHDNSCTTKNPVSPGSGEKFYYETDYTGAGAHSLEFSRLYRSNFRGLQRIANGWTHNWQRSIDVISAASVNGSTANVQKADGKHIAFKYNGASWVAQTNGQFDTLTELKANGVRTGWQLNVWADDSVEYYDATGALLKIVQRNGWTSTITYSTATTAGAVAPFAGLPITITNNFGRQLQLQYNATGQLIKLIDPAGGIIQYGYDASLNLTKITWQDNTSRQYLYANPYDGRLTGVIDELGVRIGTFSYDTQGRVLSSEKANGAEKLTFSYGTNSTTIKDITNAKTITHSFGSAQGVMRPTKISGASPLCGNTAAATTYDANGNVTQRNEHDGTITKFTYDAKNRETSRVEAAGTTAAKTYTTQWHATWNLPLLRTEPLLLTTFNYDLNANLLVQTSVPTTDINGSKGSLAVRDNANPIRVQNTTYDNTQKIVSTNYISQSKNNINQWVNVTLVTVNFSYSQDGDLILTTPTVNSLIVENNENEKGILFAFNKINSSKISFEFERDIQKLNILDGSGDTRFDFDESPASRLYAQLPPIRSMPPTFPTLVLMPTLPPNVIPPGTGVLPGITFPKPTGCYGTLCITRVNPDIAAF